MKSILCHIIFVFFLSLVASKNPPFTYNECAPIGSNKEKFYKSAIEGGNSNDPMQQYDVLKLMKKLASTSNDDEIIEYQFLPTIISFLNSANSTIKEEAALFLQYFAKNSSENAEAVAENGAIPEFLKLLHTSDEKLVTCSLWFFPTILHLREQYDELELVKNLKKLIDSKPSNDVINDAAMLLYKLCQINPKRETVKKLLPTLVNLINHPKSDVIKRAYLAISILAENKQYREVFVKEEIIKNFIHLLKHSDTNVQKTALLVIGNAVYDENTEFMVDSGIFKYMPNLLKSSDREVIKLAMDVIRNLIVGLKTEIIKTIDPEFIPLIVAQLSASDGTQDVAALLINYFAINGSNKHISSMLKANVISEFCKILKKSRSTNIQSTYTILIGYYSILKKAGDHKCSIFYQLEKCGGINIFIELEDYTNNKIKKLALKLVDLYELHSGEDTCSK